MTALNSSSFIDMLFDAIRQSLLAIEAKHPNEKLSGFALRVDDEVSSVGIAACTEEVLARHPQLKEQINDWPYGDGSEFFAAVKQAIRASHEQAESDADDSHLTRHVDAAFEAFTLALGRIRATGLAPDSAVLLAVGVDPGPSIQARSAVLRRSVNHE